MLVKVDRLVFKLLLDFWDARSLSLEEGITFLSKCSTTLRRLNRHVAVRSGRATLFNLLEVGVHFRDQEKRVVHQVVLSHEGNVLQDLLAYHSHVVSLEAEELVILRDRLQIDILKAVLHGEWHVNLAIDDTSFKVELTMLILHLEEEVIHHENVHLLNIFHLDRVDTIDFGNKTLWVVFQMIQVAWQGLFQHSLLTCVHRLNQESLIER